MPPEPRAAAGPHAQFAVPVLLLIVFVSLIGFGVVIPLLPFFATVFDAAPWQVTLLFATFSAGQFLGELTWGRLSDRIGRRPVLLVTTLASAVGYLALAFSPNIWVAILVRGLAGFFSGNISTIQAYIVDVTPPERLAGRLGLIGGAFGIGFTVGPWLGGVLADPSAGAAGFHPPLLTSAALCVVATVGMLAFVRESRRGDVEHKGRRPGPIASLVAAWDDAVLRRLLGMTFCGFAAFSAMWSVFGLWGAAEFGWGPKEIGTVMGVTGVAAALSQSFFSGMLVRRLREAPVIILGLGIAGVSLLVQAFSPEWFVVVAMTAAVTGHTLTQPATSALISRAAPANRQGAILGANNAAGSAARVVGPVLAGLMFSASHAAPVIFAGLGMAPAAYLAWRAGQQLKLRAAA